MDRRRHTAALAGLVTLSCLVQLVLIQRATVPALDAVRFVQTARRIDLDGLGETLRHGREEPLFPGWVWLVHEGLERAGGQLRSSWAKSVQLAAAIPLVLVVVPVYFVSVRLVGPAAGLAGSLLFCALPEVSRLGADGLSDSTHLLFFCLAFWAVVVHLRQPGEEGARVEGPEVRGQGLGGRGQDSAARRNPSWLLAAGMLAALALLVRAEALVLLVALVVTLFVFQLQSQRRQPWTRLAAAAACLALGCGLVWGPCLVSRKVESRESRVESGSRTWELGTSDLRLPTSDFRPPTSTVVATGADIWRLAGGEPMSFAPKEPSTSLRHRGYAAAAFQLAEELADAFGYLIGPLALFGVWRLRPRLMRPVDRFAQTYLLLFLLAVLHFAAKEGYVSARHLLTVVVVAVGCGGYGALEAGRWITGSRRAGSWTVVVLAMLFLFSEVVEPLGVNRLGHRLAAEWLAEEADAPGCVLDTRGWTGLYSGRATFGYDDARAAFGHPRLAYVVLERRELEYDSRRSRTMKHLLEVAGEPVAAFPDPKCAAPAQSVVAVYRWNAERFSQWVAGRQKRQETNEDRHARTPARVHRERS